MKRKLLFILFLWGSVISAQQTNSLVHQIQKSEYKSEYYNPAEDLLYWFISEITYGILIESFFEKDTPMHDAAITPYPYFYPNEGNYTYDEEPVSFRLETAGALLLDNHKNITGNFKAKLRFAKRMDITAEYIHLFTDENPSVDVSYTDFLLNYHRIRTRQLDFWYGLGVVFSKNQADSSGMAFNLGSELFLGKNLSAEGLIKWSVFENGHARFTGFNVNYYVAHWRFQAGVRNYKYAMSKASTVQLGVKYYF